MLLAIGLQESGLCKRRQLGGPARGFWQFERNGIIGVLRHRETIGPLNKALNTLCYLPNESECYDAVEHNDVLAAVFARLLLWTLPSALPTKDETAIGWTQYLDAWRPGRPHEARWSGNYRAAWAHVEQSDGPV